MLINPVRVWTVHGTEEVTYKNIFSDSPNGSEESSTKLSNEYPKPACPSISRVFRAIHAFMSSTLAMPSLGTRVASALRI